MSSMESQYAVGMRSDRDGRKRYTTASSPASRRNCKRFETLSENTGMSTCVLIESAKLMSAMMAEVMTILTCGCIGLIKQTYRIRIASRATWAMLPILTKSPSSGAIRKYSPAAAAHTPSVTTLSRTGRGFASVLKRSRITASASGMI